mmetsp:Transcript_17565/g.24764  ORF Transcript_17565/g.24764 Transcript_17565/m.24764 type:complete len:290 (+) Transcript_17565:145-1014(+)
MSVSSCLSSGSKGCMIVRTLEESLGESDIYSAEIRRQIRKSRKSLNLSSDTISNDSKSIVKRNTSISNTSNCSKSEISVSFESVEFREYPIILGDNPAVSTGAPLTIDWDYQQVDKVQIDEYESKRPARRSYVQMAIPKRHREELLVENGCTRREILKRVKEVNLSRLNRRRTVEMLHQTQVQVRVEKMKRGLKNMLTRNKKREKAWIKASIDLGKKERAEADQFAEYELAALEAAMSEAGLSISSSEVEEIASLSGYSVDEAQELANNLENDRSDDDDIPKTLELSKD